MENLFIHLRPIPRLFPHPLPVANIGYHPRKKRWCRQTFDTFNFSFILSGAGQYRTESRSWTIEAPCVITQWPGLYFEYGPTPVWEEFFIMYEKSILAGLKRSGVASPDRLLWGVRDPVVVRDRVAALREQMAHVQDPGVADRVDRLCESLVLESLIGEAQPVSDGREQAIRQVQNDLRNRFRERQDFDQLARRHGMSSSAFRRRWIRSVGVPPGHYVMRLRIEKACRLLVETSMNVGEIASAVGFRDPLYFSRRFHQLMGMTATGYRRRNQSPSIGRE